MKTASNSNQNQDEGNTRFLSTLRKEVSEVNVKNLISGVQDVVFLNPRNYVLLRLSLKHSSRQDVIDDDDLIKFLLTIMDSKQKNMKFEITYKKVMYKDYIVYLHDINEYIGFILVKQDFPLFMHIFDAYWDYMKNNLKSEKFQNTEEFLLEDSDADMFMELTSEFLKKNFNMNVTEFIEEVKSLSILQNVKIKSLESINQDLKYYKQFLNPTRLILLKLFYDLRHVPIRLVKKRLNITWGSLHTYLKPFQDEGLIIVKKGFVDDQVQTIVTITDKGILTYENLRNVLNNMFFN